MSDLSRRTFYGLELELRAVCGARAVRVVHPGGQTIREHHHDWACLTIHALGSCVERYDEAELALSGPAAVFHPPGSPHSDAVGDDGLETVSIEFDPDWLRHAAPDLDVARPRHWSGGCAGAAARELAALWASCKRTDAVLADAVAAFMRRPQEASAHRNPAWLAYVCEALKAVGPPSTAELARRLRMHPAWLAHAYRAAVGEGIRETVRRRRVARAVSMLRGTDAELATIAVAAGFCDQAHMNRCFRAVMNRTPLAVRGERGWLRGAVREQHTNTIVVRRRPERGHARCSS